MAERQVTLDNETFSLPDNFFLIATQNPVESHGAYPLPEAQLDRFAMKLRIGYPDLENEVELLEQNIGSPVDRSDIPSVMDIRQLSEIQQEVSSVEVVEKVRRYLVELGRATREHPHIDIGLSPRALITWQRIAQAVAFLDERDFVTPDDIRNCAGPILELRLSGDLNEQNAVVGEVLDKVSVPLG